MYSRKVRWCKWLGSLSALVLLLPACSGTRSGTPNAEGFSLVDVTKKAGIEFTHQRPTMDPVLNNVMPWMTSLGAAVAVGDANNDGCPDFYVTNSGANSMNRLYQNQCDGTFADVTEGAGVGDQNRAGESMGAVWGDYDNDGLVDLYVYKFSARNELFHNDGDNRFTRVTDTAGVGFRGNTAHAMWFDYDRDGCLDLYVSAYFRTDTDLWRLSNTRIMHDDFERARNGGRNLLYKGDCNGHFTDVAPVVGVDDPGWSLAAGAADLNGDGWPDLYVANDFGPDSLFLSEEGKRFHKSATPRGIGSDTHKGMNVDFGDPFGDDRWSIYVTNITKPGYLIEGNMLWRNLGSNHYENVAAKAGVDACGWGWGAKFLDINNDGRLDIMVTNGFVSAGKADYWYELGTMATTPGKVVAEAKNWPAMGNKSLSGHESKCIFLNSGNGQFRSVGEAVGLNSKYDGRGIAVLDYNRDGAPDILMANQSAPLVLYENRTFQANHWIQFKLRGRAPSNRQAIGAEIRVTAGGANYLRMIDGGHGFASQSDTVAYIGLGTADKIDRVEIRWPSGRIQVLNNVAVDRLVQVEEADGPTGR